MNDFKPIFSAGNLNLYKFPNFYGASVVRDPQTNTFQTAVVKHFADDSGWAIHYHTPVGPPRDGVAESELPSFLASINALTEPDVQAHIKKLFPPLDEPPPTETKN